ncbi:hypothetical protein GCM10020221_10820 [Streptomyces thioluteus]|uniref:Uncharacterized protein n=1 Tax=Streptomyces thioluteus TaxID=66431 RepID=A0ABN3WII2_STRTU
MSDWYVLARSRRRAGGELPQGSVSNKHSLRAVLCRMPASAAGIRPSMPICHTALLFVMRRTTLAMTHPDITGAAPAMAPGQLPWRSAMPCSSTLALSLAVGHPTAVQPGWSYM